MTPKTNFRALALVLTAACASWSASSLAEPLRRQAGLGLAMVVSDTAAPPQVEQVFPNLTAAKLGVRPGDVILEVGGRAVSDRAAVIAYADSLRANDPVSLRLRREGKLITIKGRAIGRPFESYPNANVAYGSVAFRGGELRDILVTPLNQPDAPIVFLLPGYSCASIEPRIPDHPYRQLAAELLKHGIGYYRVEKPFLGDSVGPLDCRDIDFATELDAFRTAYNSLIRTRGILADRIFLFGHSLGGMEAPLVAEQDPPRGVAVFGTVLRNWADYHQDVDWIQSFIVSGDDPVASAEQAESDRDLIRKFYFDRTAPAELALQKPGNDAALRQIFSWDGGEHTLGRSYKFNQDLAHLPLMKAWRDAKTNVLAMYGESDIEALNDEDHRLIADIVDFYRPGSGRFVAVPNTGHGMDSVGTKNENRKQTIETGAPPRGKFNPAVADILAKWIQEVMSRPPVKNQAFPNRAAAAEQAK